MNASCVFFLEPFAFGNTPQAITFFTLLFSALCKIEKPFVFFLSLSIYLPSHTTTLHAISCKALLSKAAFF